LEFPDAPGPAFTGSWERDGALIFCCANQSSTDWLKGLSGDIMLEGVPLRTLPAEEIPKRYGRIPLAHVPIAHVHTHRPVLRVFPLDHQSENFILN